MDKRSSLIAVLLLAMACHGTAAFASENGERRMAPGIHEVGDDELSDMRGRYIVGDNTVLWFGVEMISTWQTRSGLLLQGTLTLALDFSKDSRQPQVSFVPTVTIATLGGTSSAAASADVSRNVRSGGLTNISGMTQSVQIAGDNNAAINATRLNIQSGRQATVSSPSGNVAALAPTPGSANVAVGASSSTSTFTANGNAPSLAPADMEPAPTTNAGIQTLESRTASAGNASVSSTYTNDSAQVNLSVDGQGPASQWIRPGSLGQTIALTADNQVVTNQMIVNLVTQPVNAVTSQLARSLAQSLNMNRSNR